MRYLAESNKKIGDSANNFRITRGIGQKSRHSAGYPIFSMANTSYYGMLYLCKIKTKFMKVVLLTGGIGSGKSAVRRILAAEGVPCYDADSAVKSFYHEAPEENDRTADGKTGLKTGHPYLLPEIERQLGQSFRGADGEFDSRALAGVIFNDAAKLKIVEKIVFPALADDFRVWLERVSSNSDAPFAVFESATALDKPDFPKVWDRCLWVDAPEELRIERVMERDHCTREQVLGRIRLQSGIETHRADIDAVILNDCSLNELRHRVERALKSL